MTIAVRPPEYLPRLAFMALMREVDVFVLADTFQYSRQSFQNRTRIRTPDGWHWISVPLQGRQHGRPIVDTRIDNSVAWQSKHRRALTYNYSKTPYYAFLQDHLRPVFTSTWNDLASLSCSTAAILHQLFKVKARLVRASALPGQPASLPAVLERFDVTTFVSPREAFQQEKSCFSETACFSFEEPAYRQQFPGFEAQITAFDALCNYGPEAAGLLHAG